jgi:hypothetical protein
LLADSAIHPVRSLPQFEVIVWYFGLFLTAAVIWRLFSLRLINRYPALTWCLGVQLFRSVTLLTLDLRTNIYALTYFTTLPILLVAYVSVALELYSRSLENYRGLFIVGRRVMLGVLAISAAVAILIHVGELNSAGEQFQVIRAVLLVESAVCLMLLIFLVAIAAFLIWYPASVRRNLLLYSLTFSIFMAAQCATIFLRNSNPAALAGIASTTRIVLDDLNRLAMVVFFSAAGEFDRRPSVGSLTARRKQRLLSQLRHLNDALESKGKATPSQ